MRIFRITAIAGIIRKTRRLRYLPTYRVVVPALMVIALTVCAFSMYHLVNQTQRQPKVTQQDYDFIPEIPNHFYDKHDDLLLTVKETQRLVANESYFKLRRDKVTPQDFDFIIENPNVCDKHEDLFLIVLVLSIQPELPVREMVRDTWGSFPNVSMKMVFLFGTAENDSQNELIKEEHEKYGDLIQADFVESYQNLSYKILTGLRWVSLHCRHVKYVLKTDMDTFVNIPLLVEMLKHNPHAADGTIYGSLIPHSRPHRKGQFAVPEDSYPLPYYPPYVSGTSYVISGNIVTSLYTASQYFPYLNIEDALITGCLRTVIGAKYKALPNFSRWVDNAPDACEFIREKQIAKSSVNITLMNEIWIKLHDSPTSCNVTSA